MKWGYIPPWRLFMVTLRKASAYALRFGSTKPWQEHHPFGLDDPPWCDGRDDGCRGLDRPGSLRDLCRACVGTYLGVWASSDHGQPPRPQTGKGEGADRGAGLRASLPTLLLTGFQPDRGSVQQDQGYGAPSGSSHEGGLG